MTHCQRILQALHDGQWHTTSALYHQVGPCILHSRISDLRTKGHTVEGRHVPGKTGPDGYEYRLIESDPGEVPASSTDGGAQPWQGRVAGSDKVRRPANTPLDAAAEQLALHVAPQHYDI